MRSKGKLFSCCIFKLCDFPREKSPFAGGFYGIGDKYDLLKVSVMIRICLYAGMNQWFPNNL